MTQQYYPAVETHLLPSKHVAQTFKVQVMQPLRGHGVNKPMPVVYATDGNLTFDVLKGIAYSIQRSELDAPGFMVVGIGYPAECPLAGNVLRARDFTFEGYPRMAMKPPSIDGVLVPPQGAKNYFGGEDFQRFIAEELVPFIDERYSTAPGERIYFGHSAGGGFGLYTLFRRPELFQHYIISSPSLAYHGVSTAGIEYDNYEFMLNEASRFIEAGPRFSGTRLYLSVGSEEETQAGYEPWRLTSSFHRLAATLHGAQIPGLQLITEVFRETHMTVWPIAFVHGVQAVFESGPWKRAAP